MKSAFAICLSATAVMLSCDTGLGQIQQVSHCDCDQSGSYVGYQSSQWSGCDSCQSGHRGLTPRRGNPQLADFWLKNRFGSCCATKAYPDSGWAPPAHVPAHYDGAWYGSYHPQALYGNPGGGFVANYPVVYAPTDTTQLGYYYTKVPTWQSRPDLIPHAPNPSNFHHRVCPDNDAGCFGGHSHGGYQQPCQTCNNGYANGQVMIERPQYMTPKGSHVVRQAAPEKKGLLGGFRLTSMTELFE